MLDILVNKFVEQLVRSFLIQTLPRAPLKESEYETPALEQEFPTRSARIPWGCETSFQGMQEVSILRTGTWLIYCTPSAVSKISFVRGAGVKKVGNHWLYNISYLYSQELH